MTPELPDTILDHPALAGRRVHVRRGAHWETWEVRRDGGLVAVPATERPDAHGWRTSTAL